MSTRVLVLGGYGTFGSFICRNLSEDEGLTVIVAGRSLEKARDLAESLPAAEAEQIDVTEPLGPVLARIRPDIVIHTSGPFQGQSYAVAEACIEAGCHYIDLADGRDFVTGIGRLDGVAKAKGVTVVSGASSVPCLTSTIADHYRSRFSCLTRLDYAIATAQRTGRGLATTTAILGYVGRPFTTLIDGSRRTVHGWQGLTARRYGDLGTRLLGYCDIPDLELFPERYPDLRTIRFRAGLEVPFSHLGLWGLSWLVRFGLVRSLVPLAPLLLKASNLFDRFGSDASAFHMTMSGTDEAGAETSLTLELVARSGDGPNIPCIPSILLARKLAVKSLGASGAMPCVGLIALEEYLAALAPLDISWKETEQRPA
ncbi:saccharopine dehydrogenase NADP-binding domain-containing protein [Nisaea acidiphila]|uniref:Saccharopine dehydrogenase NADP-binding domain-containing protein n=1 Tax=Nisaea acidiphila TaxID=1862145 RepID=A0A9J7B2I0_9PROT|nr:saccharopine dehydrogenase NADP-binding domain-containing protein [Nisaea acidiphila]UUX51869.1 saccharopine dehydrogenase NADP-binding domain-containing protein [Nisaea acidiphila]